MFRSADVILLPSRHEAFPYTILEGFSYSHPVISSPTGAIPDIISPGNDGFLVDSTDYKTLAEKMIFFCDNKNELFKMSKNARLKVLDNYSFKKMEDVFGSLYSRV
jgi:glycosyltransferase involved in cell wall biosynthesis